MADAGGAHLERVAHAARAGRLAGMDGVGHAELAGAAEQVQIVIGGEQRLRARQVERHDSAIFYEVL